MSYELPDEVSTFKQGPNLEVTQNNSTTCHSANCILMQSPKKGEAFWTAEVNKMIKTDKAPIQEGDVKAIVDCLAKTY